MILVRKQLIHLPVETADGRKIGRVVDVEINQETHEITQYHVGLGDLLVPVVSLKTILVAPSQVISIDDRRMVIDDALITDSLPAAAS